MNDEIIAGVDIGGSHITVALINLNTNKIIPGSLKRSEIDSLLESESIISSWSQVIKESFASKGISPTKVGIAMPGPFDYNNGICFIKGQNKYESLYGVNIKEKLADELNIETDKIIFSNDAACFLQGELVVDSVQGADKVMGFTFGTGLGSAKYLYGEAQDANLWCSDYLDGIAEDFLSGRWFAKRYEELTGKRIRGVKELTEKWKDDQSIQNVFDEFGYNLAGFLCPLIKNEQLQLVVLGGNISKAYPLFSGSLKSRLAKEQALVEIKTAEQGENAALIGAAHTAGRVRTRSL